MLTILLVMNLVALIVIALLLYGAITGLVSITDKVVSYLGRFERDGIKFRNEFKGE